MQTVATPSPVVTDASPWASEGQQADGQFAIELSKYWRRAVENRFIIAGIFIVTILAAVATTLLQTQLFRSTAQIEISRVDNTATASIDGEPVTRMEARDIQYYNTQYELLASRQTALEVVEALNLDQDDRFLNAFGFSSAEIPSDIAASVIRENVTIEPVERSNLVDIIVSSPDSGLSAQIANAWADQFLKLNFEKRFGDTILARSQLEDQLQEMRTRLEESEARLNDYANANEIIVTSTGGEVGDATRSTLLAEQLSTVSAALANATVARVSAESAMRSGVTNEPAGGSAADGRLGEARAQLAELRTTFGPQHPRVQAMQAQIDELERASRNARGQSREGIQAAYRSALRNEQELQRRFEAIKNSYLAQQGNGVEYGILEREVRTNREIYDGLLQRYKELGTVGSGTNNMTVVERARPAGSPYHPSLIINLAIALALASLIAIAALYILNLLDQTVRDPEEIRRQFGLQLFGVIPRSDEDLADALHDRHSVISEAYASTRTSLQFFARERDLKTIMLTSSHPAEGKTTSAVALAKSFADVGSKVALVDLDLRRRGLTQLLGKEHGRSGSAAFLQNDDERVTLQRNEELGFDFLPANASEVSPVVLLSGLKLKMLINQLREEYDHIIVDGPPVIGLADALELGSHIDATVFAIKANSGSKQAIQRSLSRLRDADANLIGGILTQVDSRNEGYGYSYQYAYDYREQDAEKQ